MSTKTASTAKSAIIESRDQLIASFARGEKPSDRWRIGTEHEKFVYALGDHHAPSYDEASGIRALLGQLEQYGWAPVMEGGNVIALTGADGSISLEPAGQFELSGAPLDNLHQTCAETGRHLQQVKAAGDKLGVGFLGLGMWPDKTRAELPIMPKGRYAIMLRHMPRVGSLGLDMMLRTSTIQVNLDYASEADMVKKFRVGLALQPLATALFANSPFTEGKPNGKLSFRSHIWSDTDPARTGMLPFVFEEGFGYERYADYALDVPMYFVYREGKYIDAAGLSFRDFLKGELSVLPGELPTIDDWNDHLSTAFPEVRLKTFLEMRGADGGPWNRICALPALWVGLLYDNGALDAAWDLVKDWSLDERQALRDSVPELALDAPLPGRAVARYRGRGARYRACRVGGARAVERGGG
ncbi:glutamate--cysteine ligase [Sphingomonas yabuuchiae]